MTVHLGIDPGLTGALAVVDDDGAEVFTTPTLKSGSKWVYDLPGMVALLDNFNGGYAVLEKLQPMRLEHGGVQANYQRGRAMALWEMALVALEIPYELVAPRVWMKTMHAGTPEGDTKQRSIIAAKRLFPSVSLRRTARCRKDSDGMAESLLLAEYGRRRRAGEAA